MNDIAIADNYLEFAKKKLAELRANNENEAIKPKLKVKAKPKLNIPPDPFADIEEEPLKNYRWNDDKGIYVELHDTYAPIPLTVCDPKINKEIEEEANLIRIDLDKAAKMLTYDALRLVENMEDIDTNSDTYLQVYDKYYDILFKSKS